MNNKSIEKSTLKTTKEHEILSYKIEELIKLQKKIVDRINKTIEDIGKRIFV